MTPSFWDKFAILGAWLVATLLLLKFITFVAEVPAAEMIGGTAFRSARDAIRGTVTPGTVGGSPSSKSSRTSGSTSKPSAGSSTETASSTCTIRVEKYADGCSDLVTDCKGLQYWELYPCERH